MWSLLALGSKDPQQGFHELLGRRVFLAIKYYRGWAELFKMLTNTTISLFIVAYTNTFQIPLLVMV